MTFERSLLMAVVATTDRRIVTAAAPTHSRAVRRLHESAKGRSLTQNRLYYFPLERGGLY